MTPHAAVFRIDYGNVRRHGFRIIFRETLSDDFPVGELLDLHAYIYDPEALAYYPDEYALLMAEEINPVAKIQPRVRPPS